MQSVFQKISLVVICCNLFLVALAQPKPLAPTQVEAIKKEVLTSVTGKEKAVQEMVDMVFSFGELGFQEVETSKYLISILEKNGFSI